MTSTCLVKTYKLSKRSNSFNNINNISSLNSCSSINRCRTSNITCSISSFNLLHHCIMVVGCDVVSQSLCSILFSDPVCLPQVVHGPKLCNHHRHQGRPTTKIYPPSQCQETKGSHQDLPHGGTKIVMKHCHRN